MKKQIWCGWLTVLVLAGITVAVIAPSRASAAVGTNPQMAFQGKVVLANGTNIANGTYNVEYKIYTGGTSTGGGTLQWTEDYLIGGTGGITVNNGVFSVNLGAITSLASVDFNSDTLWLSLQVGNTATCTIITTFQTNCGGDGEMTPYIRLTSVPYAFNSSKVGGLTASQLVQLSPGSQQTGSINISGAGTFGGALAVTSLATLSGGATLAANQNLTLNSGTGSFVQGYLAGVNGSAQNSTVTNSNASATVATLNAHNIALLGGTNANAGANVLNGINFATVTPVTNNAFYGLNFGTGFNDLLRYNGTQLISGTGLLQSAAISGTYANLTGTGALATGSIASGFGTISTANTITTSTTLQGSTVNATTSFTVAGTNINTSGTLSNVAYLSQANNFTAANTFSAAGTALTVTNTASLGALSVGAITTTGNFGQTGATTLSTGTGAISLNGSTTLAANQSLTLTSGNGVILQTFSSGVNGNAQASTVTNTNASATVANVIAHNIALVGGTNANAGANILNGLNFATVTPVTNNVFYGLNFGTGFNDILRYNGTQLISGTGLLQSAAVSGTYGNLTGTGALAVGSIATGFGTISTANTISSSTTLQGATVNATTSLTLAGVDINTAGTLTNVAYLNQANTFTSTNAFNGAVTVTNNLTVNTGTANQLLISSGTNVPTTDQLSIDNTASTGVNTAGVNGANIKYKGGTAASIESSGMRIDYTPGSGASSVWNGTRIVATSAAGTNVTANGIKLDGPASAGLGTDKAVAVGTGWDIGLDVQSGGLQLAALAANPAVPAAGNIRAYAYKIAGRTMLKILSPNGVDYALQPSLAQQSIFLVTPGSGATTTTYSATGGSVLAAGVLNAAVGNATESEGYTGNIATAATIGSAAGVSNGVNQYFRGSVVNGANGFFYFARISLPDLLAKYNSSTTGSRLFFGLSDQTLATMVASDNPAGNYAGVAYSGVRDTGGAFQFVTKNGTTQTVATTGVTLAVSKTYDIYVYVSPQGTTLNWRIDNLTDGIAPVEGTQTLTLPTTTAPMKSMIDIAPLEAVAHNLRFQRVYVETDR